MDDVLGRSKTTSSAFYLLMNAWSNTDFNTACSRIQKNWSLIQIRTRPFHVPHVSHFSMLEIQLHNIFGFQVPLSLEGWLRWLQHEVLGNARGRASWERSLARKRLLVAVGGQTVGESLLLGLKCFRICGRQSFYHSLPGILKNPLSSSFILAFWSLAVVFLGLSSWKAIQLAELFDDGAVVSAACLGHKRGHRNDWWSWMIPQSLVSSCT